MPLQYLTDDRGRVAAVVVPAAEWRELQRQLRRYKQRLRVRRDLAEAFDHIVRLRSGEKLTLEGLIDDL